MIYVSVYIADCSVLDWLPAGKGSNVQKNDMAQSNTEELQVKSNTRYTL